MAKKIPSTKTSRIAVGPHNKYKLEPAEARTHYGEHRTISGGQPYAFPAKRAREAWFVLSDWSGKRLGLLEEGSRDWSFSKIRSEEQTPRWLKAEYSDTPPVIYYTDRHLFSGATPEEAIAHAEGIKLPPPPRPPPRGMTKKKAAQLQREIDEALAGTKTW